MSTHTGTCHSGKQCTAVPTSHYLPTAKCTWQAMLVFMHPCNLVGEMPQTPERFQRNRLRSCGAEHHSILKSESRIFRLTVFRQIRFFLISVDCHFAKVCAHILYSKLRHPRLYQAEFSFIYEKFDLYRSLAIPVVWHRDSSLRLEGVYTHYITTAAEFSIVHSEVVVQKYAGKHTGSQ